MRGIWTTLFLLIFSITSFAQAVELESEPYEAGKEYIVLPESYSLGTTAQASLQSHPDSIEVLGFFNYGCPVCYRMEPVIEEWHRQQEELQLVSFTDVPVAWNHPGWDNLARAFYIAEALDVSDLVQPRLFRAVHQQGKRFTTKEDLEEFFIGEAGVSRKQFEENYNSFDVRRKLKQAELLRDAYHIRSIPAYIVAGKYMVDVQTAGGPTQVVDVIEFLVSKESFSEGVEELGFDDVQQGIDHSQDDVYQLGDEQNNHEDIAPSTAPE